MTNIDSLPAYDFMVTPSCDKHQQKEKHGNNSTGYGRHEKLAIYAKR